VNNLIEFQHKILNERVDDPDILMSRLRKAQTKQEKNEVLDLVNSIVL